MKFRRGLCLFLILAMCVPLFASCKGGEKTPEPTTEIVTQTAVPESTLTDNKTDATPTSTEEKVQLPSSSTLVGSKHLPPIDSQGSIGSCSAQAVTYTQFTVAVSQYINNVLKDTSWDPSSGYKRYIFSPKFSFVYSGAGTKYSYDILVDQGCLPLTVSTFYKPNDTGPIVNGAGSVQNNKLSKSWDVDEGELLQALKYRLTAYEEYEFDTFNYDFKTAQGQNHLEKVKKSVSEGNVVVVCGWAYYWQYATIENAGTLGKKGDACIWAGVNGNSSDGNHAVSIVGYDDDITVTIGSATLKGAFQIANSWGDSYQNDGYVWMMYDAFNKVSEHPQLADEGYYSGSFAFYSTNKLSDARLKKMYGADENMLMDFTNTGKMGKLDDKEYPIYTVTDKIYGRYLSVNSANKIIWADDLDEYCEFMFIPFEDYRAWSNIDIKEDEESEYVGSYLVCSVKMSKNTSKTKCFVSLTGSQNITGKEAALSKPNGKGSLSNFAFMLAGYKNKGEESCVSSIKTFYETAKSTVQRTGALYRTSFVRWQDVRVGEKNLVVEVELEAVKREALKITLFRSDVNGNVVSRLPQIISNIQKLDNPMNSPTGDTRFDGDPSNGTMDKAFFGFGYNSLANLGEHYKPEDLLWGVTIKGNVLGVNIKSIKLTDENGNVLSTIKVNQEDSYLEKGQERSFYFDLGGEIKSFSGMPAENTVIVNAGTGKYLVRDGAKFKLDDSLKADSTMNFIYDSATDSYKIFDVEKTHCLDVQKSSLGEGVRVLYNNEREDRTATQRWKVESADDGSLYIKLASNPEYRIKYDVAKKMLVITKEAVTDGSDKWKAISSTTSSLDIVAVNKNGKIEINGIVPKDYTSGDITVKISNQDGTTNAVSVKATPNDGKFTATVELPNGTYVFSPVYNGNIYGFQYILTVK